ncbi:hypothetical protein HYC85_022495 [Camellia sinensis]|uniref:Uncharacterized protein n=1 Tax=Camellia sinensis TaxID=4442 RepID=A0A7J7GPL1_CAMSI|nr:hypothetical protein HYC85_022495 [Camellia sinensis]
MASNLLVPDPVCSLTSSRFPLHKRSQLSLESPSICKAQVSKTLWFYCNCMTSNTSSSSVTKKTQPGDQTIVRRLANYKPPVWKYDFLQSLTSTYVVLRGEGNLPNLMACGLDGWWKVEEDKPEVVAGGGSGISCGNSDR